MKLSLFWKGFIFVLAAVILVGGVVFANRILAGDAFTKEEASTRFTVTGWRVISRP